MKADDIRTMSVDDLREFAIRQQSQLFKAQRDRARLRKELEGKSAIVEHMRRSSVVAIAEELARRLKRP